MKIVNGQCSDEKDTIKKLDIGKDLGQKHEFKTYGDKTFILNLKAILS